LSVSGLATLAGDLDVNLVNGFVPSDHETFQVLNYNANSGQFTNVILENFPSGISLSPTYYASDMILAPTLTSIAVTPGNPSVAKGLTQQFSASGTFTDGSIQDITDSVAWTSSDITIATIDGTGLASTRGMGSVTITATDGLVSAATSLTVTAAELTSIAVTPSNPSITAGITQQLTATGTYTDGSTQDLTSTVGWTSSNTAVATVDGAGLATALTTGSATITAASGGVSGSTSLTVNPATVSSVSVAWGTAGSAPLVTASDEIRLLPAGRNTDLPWLGINRIGISLNGSVSLASGDVAVTSAIGASYGPVTVSGSAGKYLITLAQPISRADRVTITISNTQIATYTKRLDALPGDVNDDGVVTMQDALVIRNEYLGFGVVTIPALFLDVNGDGVIDVNDYNTTRRLIGSKLPPLI
jgi:hypothetical protein